MFSSRQLIKILSPNDTGETGAHQAGIVVPKDANLLSFFPDLDPREYNPRVHIDFIDDVGKRWEFAFIYYNNGLFGGTRNEYRLTRMTQFIRENLLTSGDELVLTSEDDTYKVSYRRKSPQSVKSNVLVLGNSWRVISI